MRPARASRQSSPTRRSRWASRLTFGLAVGIALAAARDAAFSRNRALHPLNAPPLDPARPSSPPPEPPSGDGSGSVTGHYSRDTDARGNDGTSARRADGPPR